MITLMLNGPVATSRLLISSAEIFKKPLWQTVWTQIRLHSDLGPPCLLLYLNLSIMLRQLFAADDFTRHHFSDTFFLGTLRVNPVFAIMSLKLINIFLNK